MGRPVFWVLPRRSNSALLVSPLKAGAVLGAGLLQVTAKQDALAASENMEGLCQAFRPGQGRRAQGLRSGWPGNAPADVWLVAAKELTPGTVSAAWAPSRLAPLGSLT